MAATTAFAAGLESTNTQFSYASEAAWATLPATTFQAARIISESLKHTKTRTRPSEIRGDRQSAPPTTTQESAAGSIVVPVYAPSAGGASPFEDFLSCVMGADWGATTTITGVGADIALNQATSTISSTTAGKFTGLLPGMVIKLNGFTNATNNTFFRVTSVPSGTSFTFATQGLTGQVTETPAGTAAKITYSTLRNGALFKSIYGQQRLDPAGTKWFRYPGMYLSRAQMSLSLGQFAQATFDAMVQQELKATSDASTGGIVAAPSTRIIDPVAGLKAVLWNDSPIASAVDEISAEISNDGAAGEYALGSSLAQGMLQGTHMSSAKFRAYFKDFSLYDSFRAETPGIFAFRVADGLGNTYSFTAHNTTLLLDGSPDADGPNKALMQGFTAEFSPDPSTTGCTFSVDRFSSTA